MEEINPGKMFEQDFIKSVPDTIFHYRFKDGTAAWGEGAATRFQSFNICDFLLFDGDLWLLELKSHKGKSIPFTAIREKQIEELSKADNFQNINPGIVFNFRDVAKTYFVPIRHVYYYITHAERKSIPIDFVEEYGTEIESEIKRTRYKYNVAEFLRKVKEN